MQTKPERRVSLQKGKQISPFLSVKSERCKLVTLRVKYQEEGTSHSNPVLANENGKDASEGNIWALHSFPQQSPQPTSAPHPPTPRKP